MDDPQATILPVYFVADESGSMTDVMGELNDGLESLLDELLKEKRASSKIRLAIFGFSDTVICHLSPSHPKHIENMPKLTVRSTTNFEAVFRELRRRIPEDVAQLKREGNLVNRPAVFFLTDGYPNNDQSWKTALQELKAPEFRERPNILAFGIRDAEPRVIKEVASKPEYAMIAAKGTDTGVAMARFCTALTKSVIKSALALATGQGELQVQKPEGFLTVPIDLV